MIEKVVNRICSGSSVSFMFAELFFYSVVSHSFLVQSTVLRKYPYCVWRCNKAVD